MCVIFVYTSLYVTSFVTGFEEPGLYACTQQQDTLFHHHTITVDINYVTFQAGVSAGSYSRCFCCDLFLRVARCPQVLKWS